MIPQKRRAQARLPAFSCALRAPFNKKSGSAGLFIPVGAKVSLVGTFVPFGCIRASPGTSHSLESVVSSEIRSAPHKTARERFESVLPAAFLRFGLKIGRSAAHDGFRLMLLGSPPDMVHSPPLRSTGLSSPCWQLPRHAHVPLRPHHPRCSGLRVQDTANAPMCAALCGAEQIFGC